MSSRYKPPNRRLCETSKVKIPVNFNDPGMGHQTIYVSIGTLPDSASGIEVFYAGGLKSGSSLEFIARDACVILSLALQNGIAVSELKTSLSRRELPDGSFAPGSVLSAIVDQLAENINAV